jgi:hypothetical protein
MTLHAPLEAAKEFGLDEREILETMIEVCDQAPSDGVVADLQEDLAAALAERILERERTRPLGVHLG